MAKEMAKEMGEEARIVAQLAVNRVRVMGEYYGLTEIQTDSLASDVATYLGLIVQTGCKP